MRRYWLLIVLLMVFSGALLAYVKLGGSPELRSERHRNNARQYLAELKINEAIIEFKNAVQADPTSPELHYEFGLALLRKQEFRAAYKEFARAIELKPEFTQARFQLATLYAANKDVGRAKQELVKIRQYDRNSKEGHYLAAHVALVEKRPQEALRELQAVLIKEPEQAAINYEIGQVHATSGDYDHAESSYRRALQIDPAFSQARIALAQLYVAMGKPEKAEEALLLATKLDPENEGLLHVLEKFYWSTRRFAEIETVYQDLLKKKPESLGARKRLVEISLIKNDRETAKQYIDQILQLNGKDTDGLFFRGRLRLAENELLQAAEDLRVVTRDAPRFAPGFYFLGEAQLRLNQLNEGKKSIVNATELAPNWIEPKVTLAQLYVTSGDSDLAADEIEKILKADPHHETALLISGALEVKKGHRQKALAIFQQVQKINPQSSAARLNTGAVYALMGKYAEALKEYEHALELDPDRIDALASIAQVHVTQNSVNAAFKRVEQQLNRSSKDAEIYQLMGQLSLHAKEYAKGIHHLQKAIELNPDLLSAYILIGQAHSAQKNFDHAIAQYAVVNKKNPKALQPLMLLGMLYNIKNDHKRANEYYQKVLDLNNNFAPAANNLAYNYAEYGGNLDVALGLAQRARQSSPNDAGIADTLGWINFKKGAYVTALSLLNESNERFKGENPTVLYHLAIVHHNRGDVKLARETLEKALALRQEFRELEESRKLLASLKQK